MMELLRIAPVSGNAIGGPKMIEPFFPKRLAPYRSWLFRIWIVPLGCAIFYPTG
jgi:hypothetical protein